MQYTENFSLRKAQYSDPADVADLNYNFDEIDDILLYNRLISAESYDATETYNTGDLAVYENVLYKCLEDNVTGVWDSTKWTATNLASEIGDGGASALEDLTDVDIDSPAEGEVLTYDGEKWVNAEGSATVTKTAEGNPIEIADGADAPLVKCVSEIQGSQDLHGYDKPWVGGAGINLARPAEVKTYTNNGVTFESDGNGHIHVFGTATGGNAVCNFDCEEYNVPDGSSHTVLFKNTEASSNIQFGFLYDSTVLDTWSLTSINRAYFGYSSLSNQSVNNYRILIINGTQLDCTISLMFVSGNVVSNQPEFSPYSNICPITAYTEGEIEVSDGDGNTTTHTTTYPDAIYRGSEDVVNGKIQVIHVYVDLSTLSWSVIQLTPDISAFVTGDLQGIAKYPPNNSTPFSGATEKYATVSVNSIYNTNCAIAMNDGGNLYVRVDGELNTPSGGLVYELATPTTTSVTPTNLPIKSLLGYTHIESSTGDMEIEYITEEYQPLVDLIEDNAVSDMTGATSSTDGTHGLVPAPEAGDEDKFLKGDGTWGTVSPTVSDDYTLTEQLVGTWLGTPMYRKVVEVSGNKAPGSTHILYQDQTINLVRFEGYVWNDYWTGAAVPLANYYNSTCFSGFDVRMSDSVDLRWYNGLGITVSKIYLIIYYTKKS